MKRKSRGNGQGCAYLRGKTWEAQIVVGWKPNSKEGGSPVPIKRRKGGFRTKKDAMAYCMGFSKSPITPLKTSLNEVYDMWERSYEDRVGESTMRGYRMAYRHFSKLHNVPIASITAKDLQECMDACTAGKSTHKLMKVTAGLIWAYAYDADYVQKDVTRNLYTGKGKVNQREPLTDEEVEKIRLAIGKEEYAEYIYALCYLGFRPGELLALKKSDYHEDYLVGGSKTEAGTNRMVPIPSQIKEIIQQRMAGEGTEFLFPMKVYSKGKLVGYRQMKDSYFRDSVFHPLMDKLGIVGKVPYCARHTYSDKLKYADGDDKAKAAIIGHTDYDFTRKHYQSTSIDDIKRVGESIK